MFADTVPVMERLLRLLRLLLAVLLCSGCGSGADSLRGFGPGRDTELTFLLPPGKSECFYQSAIENGSLEVEYQVIAGAGMDVNFEVISPRGVHIIFDSRRSDGVHMVEPLEEGDYQICFDNSFSRFSEKMVFFEIILEGAGGEEPVDEEWAGLEEPEAGLLEYKLEDIRESMDSLHRRLERSRQMQVFLRAFEARDRNLLEGNLWRVNFWSWASVVVLLCVAFTQVYTVRKLFDDKRRVCT